MRSAIGTVNDVDMANGNGQRQWPTAESHRVKETGEFQDSTPRKGAGWVGGQEATGWVVRHGQEGANVWTYGMEGGGWLEARGILLRGLRIEDRGGRGWFGV